MLSSRTFSALGTTCQVVADYHVVDDATRIAEQHVAEFDRVCSRSRADSELSRLRTGTTQPVSQLLSDALATAIRTAVRTEGLVDPTVGSAPDGRGYWRIVLDQQRRQVLVPRGVEVDLAATGKAWAADRTAWTCTTRLPGPFLVNFGGDIAVSGPTPDGGWQVAIDDRADVVGLVGSNDEACRFAPVVTVRHGGVATSTSVVRTRHRRSAARQHVVDPRTGDRVPAVWRAATVAASTCELASSASTAALVLGIDAPEWLARRGLPARLVSAAGRFVYVGDWPADPPGRSRPPGVWGRSTARSR